MRRTKGTPPNGVNIQFPIVIFTKWWGRKFSLHIDVAISLWIAPNIPEVFIPLKAEPSKLSSHFRDTTGAIPSELNSNKLIESDSQGPRKSGLTYVVTASHASISAGDLRPSVCIRI
jgi:hypothetical protein